MVELVSFATVVRQPRSQGLSANRPLRDPGNEVGCAAL